MRKPCSINGCTITSKGGLGYCGTHYQRFKKYGSPHTLKVPQGTGSVDDRGYRRIGHRKEHVIIAEKALGRPLPPGAVVHHMDGTKENRRGNLCILQDQATHLVIHWRMNAMKACGNPEWRKCPICKNHDDPSVMKVNAQKNAYYYHVACMRAYDQARRERKRELRQG